MREPNERRAKLVLDVGSHLVLWPLHQPMLGISFCSWDSYGFSFAADWRGYPLELFQKSEVAHPSFPGLPVSLIEERGTHASTPTWGRKCLQRLECSLR